MKKLILCLMFVFATCVSVEAGIEKTKYGLHRQIAKNRWVASLDTTKPENYGKCGLGIIDENGYAIVYKNSKKIERATFRDFSFNKYIGGSCGVINERGIIVIPIKYRDVEHMYRGVYKCTRKGIFALSSKINLRIWGDYLVMLNVVKKIAFFVAIVLVVKHIWGKLRRKKIFGE